MAVQRPQVNVLGFGSLWPFPGAPAAPLASSDSELWEDGLTRSWALRGQTPSKGNLTSWMDDNGGWSSLLRQDSRKEASIGLLEKFKASKTTTNSIHPKVTHAERLDLRNYLQLPMSARYVHFHLVLQPLIAWFPCGSGQKELFTWGFCVPKRPAGKSIESCFY